MQPENPSSALAANPLRRKWRVRWLAASVLLAGALLATWSLESTRAGWDRLDLAAFHLLNGSLVWGTSWQRLWALANMRVFDCIAGAFYGLLFLRFVVGDGRRFLSLRLGYGIFIAAFAFVALDLSHNALTVVRLSPSLTVDGAVRLSRVVDWPGVKDASQNSFPGDHAIALILLTAMIWFYAGRRYGLVALSGGLVFVMPRLISGAHWLSDILVGSVSISSMMLGMTLATPLHAIVSGWIGSIIGALEPRSARAARRVVQGARARVKRSHLLLNLHRWARMLARPRAAKRERRSRGQPSKASGMRALRVFLTGEARR